MTIKFKHTKKLGECVGFYNILMRSVMKCLGFVEFGRSCYDPEQKSGVHLNKYKYVFYF